ncbi:hypothetical protein D3C73_1212520 [compost metagenome]
MLNSQRLVGLAQPAGRCVLGDRRPNRLEEADLVPDFAGIVARGCQRVGLAELQHQVEVAAVRLLLLLRRGDLGCLSLGPLQHPVDRSGEAGEALHGHAVDAERIVEPVEDAPHDLVALDHRGDGGFLVDAGLVAV